MTDIAQQIKEYTEDFEYFKNKLEEINDYNPYKLKNIYKNINYLYEEVRDLLKKVKLEMYNILNKDDQEATKRIDIEEGVGSLDDQLFNQTEYFIKICNLLIKIMDSMDNEKLSDY